MGSTRVDRRWFVYLSLAASMFVLPPRGLSAAPGASSLVPAVLASPSAAHDATPATALIAAGEASSSLFVPVDVSRDDLEPRLVGLLGASSEVSGFTISGALFYNDLRKVGHFDWRDDTEGNPGGEVAYSSTTDHRNYLGALDVVADFYEVDSTGWGSDCTKEEYLGSTTVGASGEFSKSFDISDDCSRDGNSNPDITVRFRLRFCNSTVRCFSVVDAGDDTYVLWHPDAYEDNPLEIGPSDHDITLGIGYFQTSYGDIYSRAANLYASMVEGTRVWHRENGVPFDPRGDGEVFVRYPASGTNVATTRNDHLIKVPAEDSDPSTAEAWYVGKTIYHEYGHLLHMRAWDGTTGDCGDCPGGDYAMNQEDVSDPSWRPTTQEYPNSAFAEGWANFSQQVIKAYPEGCVDFDDNLDVPICSAAGPTLCANVTWPNAGKTFARNVTKLLCDWYDDRGYDDDDTNMNGSGDTFTESLYTVWSTLDGMWSWTGGDAGLQVCDFIDYYVNWRKRSTMVGASAHNAAEAAMADLAFNNGLRCGLPTP
jgi:hypothetical protein